MDAQHIRHVLAHNLQADELGVTAEGLDRLLDNIAAAIAAAIAEHEQRAHAPAPDFGEEERVEGTQ